MKVQILLLVITCFLVSNAQAQTKQEDNSRRRTINPVLANTKVTPRVRSKEIDKGLEKTTAERVSAEKLVKKRKPKRKKFIRKGWRY